MEDSEGKRFVGFEVTDTLYEALRKNAYDNHRSISESVRQLVIASPEFVKLLENMDVNPKDLSPVKRGGYRIKKYDPEFKGDVVVNIKDYQPIKDLELSPAEAIRLRKLMAQAKQKGKS